MPHPTLLTRLLRVWIHHRLLVAALAVVVVVVGSVASASLRVRNDLEAFFVSDDPVMTAYHAFRERFGTDEVVLITVSDQTSIHTPRRRSELATLSQALQAIPEVDRVNSLATVDAVVVTADGFALRPVGDDSEALLQGARKRHSPLQRLASDDDRTQLVWLWLTPEATTDTGRSRAIAAITAAVEPLRASREVRIVGGGVVWEALNALTVRDGAVFISLASVVLLLGLLAVTRRLLWGVVATVAVTCANTMVFAAMALLDVPLNAITVCLPSLVMALGVLDLLHLVTAVDDLPLDVTDPRDPRVVQALAQVAVPGLFNIVTTAVGLLALLTASTAVTRQLGGFAAIGVVCAWLFCLVWTIVALPRALNAAHRAGRRRRSGATTLTWSGRVASFSLRHRGSVVVAALACAGASAWGVSRLTVDTDTLGFLPATHQVVVDTRAVEASVGPFIPLEVDVAFAAPGAWRSAAVIEGLRTATDRLAALGPIGPAGLEATGTVHLGRAGSIADVVAEASMGLGHTSGSRLQDDDVEAAMALIMSTSPGLTEGLVSADDRHVRLTVPVTLTTARGFMAAADVVTSTVVTALAGTGATVGLTGYLPLYARIVHALVDDQLVSFGAAFVGVFLLIGIFLRSRRLVLLAAVPNLLPIAGVLGLMGISGIALDVATITIAATILGVVVDDTVHTLHHLKHRLGPGPWGQADVDAAILDAARTVGRANLAGNGLLAAGFLVLVAASAKSLVLVGALSATAVVLALVADLVLLPALASLVLPSSSPSRSSLSSKVP